MSCNYRSTETTTEFTAERDSLEAFRNIIQSWEGCVIFVTAVILHIVSIVLIITTAYMFVRHRSLRTARNMVHLNLLFSDSVLLLTDWMLLNGSEIGCEIYSFTFLVFGSSSIYTAVVIAYTRYEQMKNRSGENSSLNKRPLICIFGIWIASILATTFPIHAKAQFVFTPGTQLSPGIMCFFVDDIAYSGYKQSITFLLMVILTPAIIMSFCYVRIYQNVRHARITRWLNQAAQFYSTHTTIIKSEQRRANIVPIKHRVSQYPSQPNTISDREKHIIIKGLFSVASQLLFWVPFGIVWITNTSAGFSDDFLLQQIYIMILAKCSVITNISHYISFNVKFRKLYIKTIINPLKSGCCGTSVTMIGTDVSHISLAESSVPRPTSLNSANTLFPETLRPSALFALRPIMEEKPFYKTSIGQRMKRAALGSLSLPSRCPQRRSNIVFPLRNST